MRILIIKTSSMGDIIHTLPAITDAVANIAGIKFDWIVESGFEEIPHWHEAVQNVMVVSLRKWRRNLFKHFFEIKKCLNQIRNNNYDIIIDAQGLFKSAILARLCKGKMYCGFDAQSARESFASFLYNKKILVSKELHAIKRTRILFSEILGYKISENIKYGVNWNKFSKYKPDKPYLFFLHGTTWDTKHWPERYWQELAEIVSKNGYDVYMTWITDEQKNRVNKLSRNISAVKMLPSLSITEALAYLRGSSGVISVDTGFCHLTSALSLPIVALYGPTDPKKVGVLGVNQFNLAAQLDCAPCYKKKCCKALNDFKEPFPPCLAGLTPDKVWNKFKLCLSNDAL